MAESFTATYRCIYKEENSDQVGWSVTEEEISSVSLEEPGYRPSGWKRNVIECDLANSKHQEAQNNVNKKQQHEKMFIAGRHQRYDNIIFDPSKTESTDVVSYGTFGHGGTSALQSEVSTNAEELEQLCGKQVTAADIELEEMRQDFVLAKLKYEHEDNQKQRLHEEKMEEIQQSVERSFSQGLQNLLGPLNQYALFLYCFIVIHIVIYTVKELAAYFSQTHYMFCFAIVFFYILKNIV